MYGVPGICEKETPRHVSLLCGTWERFQQNRQNCTHTHKIYLENILSGEVASVVLAKRLHPIHGLRMGFSCLVESGWSVDSSIGNGCERVLVASIHNLVSV